jgi:hypothetical protein
MFCYSVLICETQYFNQDRSVVKLLKIIFDLHKFLTSPVIPTKCFREFCPFLTIITDCILYRQPTSCNSNGLLIIPVSSKRFGRWFSPPSGALHCVCSLRYNAPTILPAGNLEAEGLQSLRFQTTGRQHRGYIT